MTFRNRIVRALLGCIIAACSARPKHAQPKHEPARDERELDQRVRECGEW